MNRLGIDIGGSKISLGIVDDNYNILLKHKIKNNINNNINKYIIESIFKIIDESNLNIEDIGFIGIGAPGTVDVNNKLVKFCPNLSIRNWDLADKIYKLTNIETMVDNDANCATYGEYLAGNAIGYKNIIGLIIGTGIGAGIIIDKKIYRGSNFSAGEIGHMVIDFNGELCNCGKRGCFETYASISALINQVKKSINSDLKESILSEFNNIDGKVPFDAMKAGDELATSIVNKYIYYLSIGILNIIDIFSPDLIFIGGGISNEGDFLIDRIKAHVNKHNSYTKICSAKLKNDAGIIGAAYIDKSF